VSSEEVKQAAKKFQNCRAGREDELMACEILTNGGEAIFGWLLEIQQ